MKKISIIIPCRNEEHYIASCLDSIIASDYPKKDIEVIIIDGQSEDNTVSIIKAYQQKYPYIQCLNNLQKTVPFAMNIGIKNATGDYIIRIDAHAIYPSNYFSKLIEWSIKLNADNVGAVCKTDVMKKNCISNSIKVVMSDKFGVGNSKFRTGIKTLTRVDTVPFGCYKKEAFETYGLYDTRLIRTQDIEFNKRVINNGGTIYLIPDLECTYFTRETYKEFCRNRFNTGKWIPLAAYLTQSFKSVSIRHFMPMLFVLLLILPLLFSLSSVLLFFLGSYLMIMLSRGIFLQITKRTETTPFHIVLAFFILHMAYGIGSFVGIAQSILVHFKLKHL